MSAIILQMHRCSFYHWNGSISACSVWAREWDMMWCWVSYYYYYQRNWAYFHIFYARKTWLCAICIVMLAQIQPFDKAYAEGRWARDVCANKYHDDAMTMTKVVRWCFHVLHIDKMEIRLAAIGYHWAMHLECCAWALESRSSLIILVI